MLKKIFEKIRFQIKMMSKKKCKVKNLTLCDLHNVSIHINFYKNRFNNECASKNFLEIS